MSLGTSSQKSRGTSKPVLFGPDQLMTEQQKNLWSQFAPVIGQQAGEGGFSPSESASIYRRNAENINRATQGSQKRLMELYAKAGIRGRGLGRDLARVESGAISAKGKLRGDIEGLSMQERDKRFGRLLDLLTFQAPSRIGQVSRQKGSGSGFNVGLPQN
jgi:hypothetical protein